jgi:hypothetical protein
MASSSAPRRCRASVAFASRAELLARRVSSTTDSTPFPGRFFACDAVSRFSYARKRRSGSPPTRLEGSTHRPPVSEDARSSRRAVRLPAARRVYRTQSGARSSTTSSDMSGQWCAGSSRSAIARLTITSPPMTPMRSTSKSARRFRQPLCRQLVGPPGLVTLVEHRDRRHSAVSRTGDLAGDEAAFLRKRIGEIAIDSMHELIDRAVSDAVRPDAHVHGPSFA